jgi:hypothetical protein
VHALAFNRLIGCYVNPRPAGPSHHVSRFNQRAGLCLILGSIYMTNANRYDPGSVTGQNGEAGHCGPASCVPSAADAASGRGDLVLAFLTLCSVATIAVATAMVLLSARVRALEQRAPAAVASPVVSTVLQSR